ncbi:MAG: hypothetical protein ACPGSC_03715, partial [Granulosicoccaceae bacterium]
MKNKMKLGAQFLLGYGTVLTLIVAISVTSYIGLNAAVANFNEYRSLARNSNLSSRVQANMLLVRLHVKEFILKKNSQSVSDFNARLQMLNNFLNEAAVEIKDTDRLAHIREIQQYVEQYNVAFERVVQLMKKREDVVINRLNPQGLAMRTAISEIMRSAYESGDAEAAYYAGLLQEALLLGRLYAVKFLSTNAIEDKNRAQKELNENVSSQVSQLDEVLQNSLRRELLQDFKEAFEQYRAAFDETAAIILARNKYIKEELDVIGPKVAESSEVVKLSIQSRQDEIGPAAKAHNELTVERVLMLSFASVMIGLISSIILLRLIR